MMMQTRQILETIGTIVFGGALLALAIDGVMSPVLDSTDGRITAVYTKAHGDDAADENRFIASLLSPT